MVGVNKGYAFSQSLGLAQSRGALECILSCSTGSTIHQGGQPSQCCSSHSWCTPGPWMVGIIPNESVPILSLAAVHKEWGCELLAVQANSSCVPGASVQQMRFDQMQRAYNILHHHWHQQKSHLHHLTSKSLQQPPYHSATCTLQFTFSTTAKHFPWWLRQQRICLQCRRPGFDPWAGKMPWRRRWLPTPVFLPGESNEQRSLVGYSPWDNKESDTTEQLTLFHYSQSFYSKI